MGGVHREGLALHEGQRTGHSGAEGGQALRHILSQIVLTPTLTLLAEREAAIEHFKKEKFYTVELDAQGLRAASGKFNSKTDAEKLRS